MSGGGSPTGAEAGRNGIILLFASTHAALAAEERVLEAGLWCDVVPRPPGTSDSLCGLALAISGKDREQVAEMLEQKGIEFEAYQPGAGDEAE